MSSNLTDAGADMPANHGNASDNAPASSGDIEAMVAKIVNRAVVDHLKRFEKRLPQMLGAQLESKTQDPQPEQQSTVEPTQDKLTLKALQEQIAKLNQGIEAERKARAEAERAAEATRARAEVESHFVRHLGADSPHLKAYLNMYAPQFQYKDGRVIRRVEGEYGDEQELAADKAVEELFRGELKHLVARPSSAGKLPQSSYRGMNGSTIQAPKPIAPQGINPFDAELIEAIGKDRPELAQSLAAQAMQAASSQK